MRLLPAATGFTGTQKGMTPEQKDGLRRVLTEGKAETLVHGCCIGADDEADAIAACLGVHRVGIPAEHIRSVLESVMRARTGSKFLYAPTGPNGTREQPLDRNRKIVAAVRALIAAPKAPEVKRSGTWATVRMARRAKIRIIVVWPHGQVVEEE